MAGCKNSELGVIIIVSFIIESDLSINSLGQKIICWRFKGIDTLIKIGTHTLMEHEQENTIQKNKKTKKTFNNNYKFNSIFLVTFWFQINFTINICCV